MMKQLFCYAHPIFTVSKYTCSQYRTLKCKYALKGRYSSTNIKGIIVSFIEYSDRIWNDLPPPPPIHKFQFNLTFYTSYLSYILSRMATYRAGALLKWTDTDRATYS